MRRTVPLILAMALLPLAGCRKNSYESPETRVLEKEDSFELREYPGMLLVTTSMGPAAHGESFMRLFRFISGRNGLSEKIPMTTPVLMSGPESGTMSFIMPKGVARKGVPKPAEEGVLPGTAPGGLYAACRFPGYANTSAWTRNRILLEEWMKKHSLRGSGPPFFAVYNPPWTPGFLRRNEVLIPVKAP